MTDQDKPAFAVAFNRLCVALREKEPDVIQMRIYFDALKALELELVTAAATTLEKGQWFPKVGEWWTAAEAIRRERQARQREWLRKAPRPLCATCEDTGWERVAGVEKGQPVDRVRACACRKIRRQELLGQREVPALPPGPEPDLTQEQTVHEMVAHASRGLRWPH